MKTLVKVQAILISLFLIVSCATPGNEKVMKVIFVDRPDAVGAEDGLPYAEEIQICVPKIDQTLKCAGMMRTIKPPKK